MDQDLNMIMWSSSNLNLQNVDEDHKKTIQNEPEFEPTTYTFTKLENGKKTAVDSTSFTPPSWLLLDHSIAVIWSMFNVKPQSQLLTIDDLKWAYEFLRGVKNKKGENPPDVKVCLKEIQDKLINLYAKLTSLKQEDFDEIAATFKKEIIENSRGTFVNTTFTATNTNSQRKIPRPATSPLSIMRKRSNKEISGSLLELRDKNKELKKGGSKKASSRKKFPVLEEDSDSFQEVDATDAEDDEEIEKYLLSLFEDESKGDSLQAKTSTKSLIPMKKKTLQMSLEEGEEAGEAPRVHKEKTKRVHCVAEMRSLKFQKSMKVQDTNGEEAAYSNLKAEIRKLSFNPNVPRSEIMKFLKDWRSEQVNRLNNELKRLSSIEEFMKSINKEEVQQNLEKDSQLNLKEFRATKSNYCYPKSLLK